MFRESLIHYLLYKNTKTTVAARNILNCIHIIFRGKFYTMDSYFESKREIETTLLQG